MEILKQAREKHYSTNVWATYGKMLYKDMNNNKMKLYYAQLFI